VGHICSGLLPTALNQPFSAPFYRQGTRLLLLLLLLLLLRLWIALFS
jgi:hypothetical protein